MKKDIFIIMGLALVGTMAVLWMVSHPRNLINNNSAIIVQWAGEKQNCWIVKNAKVAQNEHAIYWNNGETNIFISGTLIKINIPKSNDLDKDIETAAKRNDIDLRNCNR